MGEAGQSAAGQQLPGPAATALPGKRLDALEGGEVGGVLLGSFGPCLAFGVLGQCPADAGHRGVAPLAPAGGDDRGGLDLLDGLAVRAAPQHGVQHVVGDDRRSAAVLAL
ncbi:hypothetical protein, partial [Streptomyces sp. NPDC014685]|uniref:hypothetical protein n=1 Tax=Streptomyces sp. NPDC014685 TaxID=3364881 RepID=UPI0036F5F6F8